jgi:predicted metalloprotease with PDZ domain
MLEIWEADTRGSYITILTSDTTFKSQSLQQLHEQLRHEMFHLWIPNGVNLSGNYDWFYEGFALYQSLKTGVALNRIRFDDYLDTLSRAYEVDKRLEQKLSLIELSKNRWAGDNNTRIYARGMLVAFLCDLALLEKSKGKRSVTDLLRKLYEDHRPPASEVDGNAVVLELLRSHAELKRIIDRNITGSESIDWNNLIADAGLQAETVSQTTQLKVMAKPSGRQKDLLDRLGYNYWRKLLRK